MSRKRNKNVGRIAEIEGERQNISRIFQVEGERHEQKRNVRQISEKTSRNIWNFSVALVSRHSV
jgi:hypothetical protein